MKYDQDGNPVGKVDHVQEGMDLVPVRFRGTQPDALLRSYLRQIQDLENAAWALFTGRFLDNCANVMLDQWGALVKEPRLLDTDTVYRVRIRVKIAVLRSKGRNQDLYAIALLSVGHNHLRLWCYGKTVALYLFWPIDSGASRAQLVAWFTAAKVTGDRFRLYRSFDTAPLRIGASGGVIPRYGMEFSGHRASGGRVMGGV